MYIRNTVELGDQVVKVKDLAKINLEWLAVHMPEEMLEECEERRLEQEGKVIKGKKYIPDAKIPIIEFTKKEKKELKGFIFINEEGIELRVREFGYEDTHKPYLQIESLDGTYINDETIEFYSTPIQDTGELIQYASFIDKVIGSNLEQQLKNELGVFLEKAIQSNNQFKLR